MSRIPKDIPGFKCCAWLCTAVMFVLSTARLLVDHSASALVGAAFFTACAIVVVWDIRDDRRMAAQIQRIESGRCIACGYDLRGTAATKCSECGSDQMDFDVGYS